MTMTSPEPCDVPVLYAPSPLILRTPLDVRMAHFPILQVGKLRCREGNSPKSTLGESGAAGFIIEDRLTYGPPTASSPLLHFRRCLKPSKYIILFNSETAVRSFIHTFV